MTLVLQWSNDYTTTVSLEDQNDCIFRGQFREDPASAVLVTGCEDEDFDVLYQSVVLGDNIFSTKDGHPVFIEGTEEDFSHEYYDDENYYTDYEGVPNLNIDEQFPIETKKSKKCGESECPVGCIWSEWGTWTSCSASCGGGSQFATRTVDQQATNGGEECSGQPIKSQSCGNSKCPAGKFIICNIPSCSISITCFCDFDQFNYFDQLKKFELFIYSFS